MNYRDIAKNIIAWKGFEKDYWYIVELLEKNKRLTRFQLELVKKGRSPESEILINNVLKIFKEELQLVADLDKENEKKLIAETSKKAKKNEK